MHMHTTLAQPPSSCVLQLLYIRLPRSARAWSRAASSDTRSDQKSAWRGDGGGASHLGEIRCLGQHPTNEGSASAEIGALENEQTPNSYLSHVGVRLARREEDWGAATAHARQAHEKCTRTPPANVTRDGTRDWSTAQHIHARRSGDAPSRPRGEGGSKRVILLPFTSLVQLLQQLLRLLSEPSPVRARKNCAHKPTQTEQVGLEDAQREVREGAHRTGHCAQPGLGTKD